MRFPLYMAALLVLVEIFCLADADAADYVVVPERSELVVRLTKDGIAAAVAHNHVIRATRFSGEAGFDPANLAHSRLWVEAKTASLTADEPDVRENYGLSETVSDKDRKKIQETMLSEKQMDAETFPTMTFESSSVEKNREGRYIISGNLTIHGIAKPIAFPLELEEEDGGLRGRATIDFKQSDFGITPFSAILGAVRNKDEAVLYVDIFAASVGVEAGD